MLTSSPEPKASHIAPSPGPPKSILKRPSLDKREEEQKEKFMKGSYRNREFRVDPTLFKHFEKSRNNQVSVGWLI